VVSIQEAQKISDEKSLDLVEVSPNAKPPVVKLIDYGKFKYEQQKKASEAKKKQVTIALKETQFRPNIEKHDLEVKLKRIEKFLANGDKVKLIMQFRGREMAHKHIGLEKFNQIIKMVEEFGAILESPPKPMGYRTIAIMASTVKKKPAGAKNEEAKEQKQD
jgi:translation initiation factor IF-3